MSKSGGVWSRRAYLGMIFYALIVIGINYAIYPVLNLTFLVVVTFLLMLYFVPLLIFTLVSRSRTQ